MKKTLISCILIGFLSTPSLLFAEERGINGANWDFAGQLALEMRVSPPGAALFDGIRGNSFWQISYGLGLFHPRKLGLMLRNAFGPISKSMFNGSAVAIADSIEAVVIQPLPGLSAVYSDSRICPYFGWGFSLTTVEVLPSKRRGYSAVVLETGIDIRKVTYLGIGGLRASLKILVGMENITVGLFLGTVLHPIPIARELFG